MQFIDLKRQYEIIKKDVDSAIHKVLDHGMYIMGPEIKELESALAGYTGRKYCISCSSGTDALIIPLMALGVKKDDAVFTTPFTFIATAEVISLLGATPVFVDIDPETYNIDPELLDFKISKIRSEGKLNPKVIIPVDLFGLPADYEKLEKIAEQHDIALLEDAAQAFGASYDNKKTCSFGMLSSTSFFPAKPLGCYGDGGAIFTDDEDLYNKMTSIRVHGQGIDKYTNVRIGLNGRMDSIQAAVVLSKLKIFDDEIVKRNKVAKKYSSKLNSKVKVPNIPNGYTSVWAQYSVLAENEDHRTGIIKKLNEKGVPTAIYYPIPLHLQEAFEFMSHRVGDFPISEDISQRIFSLPMHPYLTDEEIENICSSI